jgi:hypothetical protein
MSRQQSSRQHQPGLPQRRPEATPRIPSSFPAFRYPFGHPLPGRLPVADSRGRRCQMRPLAAPRKPDALLSRPVSVARRAARAIARAPDPSHPLASASCSRRRIRWASALDPPGRVGLRSPVLRSHWLSVRSWPGFLAAVLPRSIVAGFLGHTLPPIRTQNRYLQYRYLQSRQTQGQRCGCWKSCRFLRGRPGTRRFRNRPPLCLPCGRPSDPPPRRAGWPDGCRRKHPSIATKRRMAPIGSRTRGRCPSVNRVSCSPKRADRPGPLSPMPCWYRRTRVRAWKTGKSRRCLSSSVAKPFGRHQGSPRARISSHFGVAAAPAGRQFHHRWGD